MMDFLNMLPEELKTVFVAIVVAIGLIIFVKRYVLTDFTLVTQSLQAIVSRLEDHDGKRESDRQTYLQKINEALQAIYVIEKNTQKILKHIITEED